MIKLAIFDLDGTLVDSAVDITDAANRTLTHFGREPVTLETIRMFIGDGFGPFLKHTAGARSTEDEFLKEIFQKFQFFYDQQLHKNTFFYAGFENFLTQFLSHSERKAAIASNKPEYQVRVILKTLGVDHQKMVEIYGGDSFDVKKPHPKQLLELMKLANIGPAETVMIGDSLADVESAKRAGTHFVAVSFGYNSMERLRQFGAEKFIGHYDELMKVLEELG